LKVFWLRTLKKFKIRHKYDHLYQKIVDRFETRANSSLRDMSLMEDASIDDKEPDDSIMDLKRCLDREIVCLESVLAARERKIEEGYFPTMRSEGLNDVKILQKVYQDLKEHDHPSRKLFGKFMKS
jgi:TATA-binding protein-associated factor Taf7